MNKVARTAVLFDFENAIILLCDEMVSEGECFSILVSPALSATVWHSLAFIL
jgi:hypothetical protein